jgi:hypothetical protein
MKNIFTPLVLGLALFLPTHAFAASPGIIESGSGILPIDKRCSLSAGVTVIDYGTQSRWQLQEAGNGQNVSPGKRTLMVSVVCPYTQTMRLRLIGDKAANGNLRYGERGNLSLRLVEAQLDSQDVQLATTTPDGIMNGTSGSARLLQPSVGVAATRNGQLAKGKNFTVRIEMEPMMPESAARVTTRQISEANLTLELIN